MELENLVRFCGLVILSNIWLSKFESTKWVSAVLGIFFGIMALLLLGR